MTTFSNLEPVTRKPPVHLHSLTKIQKQFLKDEKHRFIVLSAGRRSRKTLLGARKLLCGPKRGAVHNVGRYFLAAPTRGQAKEIFWERLKKDTNCFRGKPAVETELKIELYNKSMIYVVGMDKPQRIEGRPWNGCHLTEVANMKASAWSENILPALSDTQGWATLDGVPEGRNHFYDHALKSCGGAIPKTYPIKGAYAEDGVRAFYTWFSSDVLSPEEIEIMRGEMDDRTFRQEMEGEFVAFGGLAYYAFSKKNLSVNLEYNENEHIHIGMDFNVNPMTATLSHIRGDTVCQFGEAFLINARTTLMAEHLKELYPIDQMTIYPDATGKHESSNAQRSDLTILRDAGFEVKANAANPRQKNRLNAVNSRMKAGDKIRYLVNPRNCPKTINDFNKVERTDDGRIDDSQKKTQLTHISDALGYMIHYLFPIDRAIATSIQA